MFNDLARRTLGDAGVFHMVDESLIRNTIAAGRLEKSTVHRLVHQIESAGSAGADAVLVTCSSIGPGVDAARPLFEFPILRIDEAMAERAVGVGRRIGVVATLSTTLAPTVALMRATAARLGRDTDVVDRLCAGAFEAVLAGDTATHDKMVAGALADLAQSVDVIVLAQASMARVVDQLPESARPVPILSSPALAMEQAAETLRNLA
jgi:Asp/Glu/hydantoin racemase